MYHGSKSEFCLMGNNVKGAVERENHNLRITLENDSRIQILKNGK